MTAALRNWSGIGPGSSDAELAVATAAGDRTAFGIIYDRYADRLHDFAIGMLRDRDSAADIVQDAFCIMSTSLGGLREPEKLRPWLYSIVRNEAHKRLRELKRERPSDEMPDVVSQDSGPDTMAQRLELANLISEAAGGLSDRDQAVLELAYRQGLDGPELAMALGVTQTNANTMVGRLRETIERSLGALLVARRIQSNPASCPELASVLHGWDGKFNILMRKRIARHIESCEACEDLRSRSVNPAALLGAPVFIPAPAWLKNSVTRDFELTSASKNMGDSSNSNTFNSAATQMAPKIDASRFAEAARPAPQPQPSPRPEDDHAFFQELSPYAGTINGSGEESKRRVVPLMALIIGLPILILGATLAWLYLPTTALSPSGVVQDAPRPTPPASVPAPTPAAVLPTPQAPRATPAPRPVQTPVRPAAPLPTPQAKIPTPQPARPPAPVPPAQAPAPAPPPVQAPAPIPQLPVGQLPFQLPRMPLPQNPAAQLPAQPPAQKQAPAPQAPPAQAPPPAQPPAQAPPPAQPPAQAPPPAQKVPDPVGPAPQQVPDPVGPAPKTVEPPAQTPCNPDVDVCVR